MAAFKVKTIELDSDANVTAEFADGHTIVLEHNDSGFSANDAFKAIYLKKGGETLVRYNSSNAVPKNVKSLGFQKQAPGYSTELFIEYVEATMDAASRQGGDVWLGTHKVYADLNDLRALIR